jgi:hypothetical protein
MPDWARSGLCRIAVNRAAKKRARKICISSFLQGSCHRRAEGNGWLGESYGPLSSNPRIILRLNFSECVHSAIGKLLQDAIPSILDA